MDAAALARRKARASWPIRRAALGEVTSELLTDASPSELVAMVHQLTMDAWAMSGASIPDYARRDTPVRILRRRS